MALQGDLESFALPDVLRLLAGTTKSGRLGVTGSSESGEVWMLDGDLVGGSVTTRPNAKTPAEVIYELLLFPDGSFLFDDGEQLVDGGDRSSVDDALTDAAHLKEEWADVTSVVPSLDHWVTIAQEIDGDEVTVNAEDWRLLAPVAAGSSVRAVGAYLDVSDLDASKRVRSLVEAGLVTLGETPEGATSSVSAADIASEDGEDRDAEVAGSSSYDEFDPDDLFVDAGYHDPSSFAAEHDLVTLSAEEGPVVLETSEDALLPEPLPGEGTAYSADLNENSSVDARIFDAAPPEPVVDLTESDDLAPAEAVAEPDQNAPVAADSAFATGWNTPGVEAEIGTSEEAFKAAGWDDTPPIDHLGGDEAASHEESGDGDRSSLLKFLSSVKP